MEIGQLRFCSSRSSYRGPFIASSCEKVSSPRRAPQTAGAVRLAPSGPTAIVYVDYEEEATVGREVHSPFLKPDVDQSVEELSSFGTI